MTNRDQTARYAASTEPDLMHVSWLIERLDQAHSAQLHSSYALIDGFTVSAWGVARTTQDIDLAITLGASESQALLSLLRNSNSSPHLSTKDNFRASLTGLHARDTARLNTIELQTKVSGLCRTSWVAYTGREIVIMQTVFKSYLALIVLITSFIGFPHLISAQSRDSSPQFLSGQERFDIENVRNEFLSRLRDHRSTEFRKESVIEYARLTKVLNDLQQEKEKLDGEFEALRSQYGSATIIPKPEVYSIAMLNSQRHQSSRVIKSTVFRMDP